MPAPELHSAARNAAHAFALGNGRLSVEPLGNGLIHDSFLVCRDRIPVAILQRINRRVFVEPARIMANLRVLLEHTAAHAGQDGLRFPAIIATREGDDLHVDADGEHWRALKYLAGTRSLAVIQNAGQARAVGEALGRFHRLLDDLPLKRLTPILRGFHETPRYLGQFDTLCAGRTEQDPAVDKAIDFVQARRELVTVLQDARARIRSRTVHGDPKLDNFLFDADARRVIGLIDLDTVQAGLVHYDIGDCLRSCCNPAGEDPPQLADAKFDAGLCRAWLDGYMEAMGPALDRDEIGLIYPALRLLPFELGIRFLNDHLDGDRYFRVSGRGQNLRRARVQFRLVQQIEEAGKELKELIAGYAAR